MSTVNVKLIVIDQIIIRCFEFVKYGRKNSKYNNAVKHFIVQLMHTIIKSLDY